MSPSALRCSQCRSGWRASGSRRSEGAQIARWSKPDAWFSRRVPGVDPLQSLELPRFHRASSSAALWSTSVPFRVRPVFPIGSAEPSANDLIERTGDRMRRREFIGLVGGAAAWPLAAAAQAPERSFRIGWLGNTDAREWAEWRGREFREGLRDLGYIEGKNLRFELRFAEGDDSPPARARRRTGRAQCGRHRDPWRGRIRRAADDLDDPDRLRRGGSRRTGLQSRASRRKYHRIDVLLRGTVGQAAGDARGDRSVAGASGSAAAQSQVPSGEEPNACRQCAGVSSPRNCRGSANSSNGRLASARSASPC